MSDVPGTSEASTAERVGDTRSWQAVARRSAAVVVDFVRLVIADPVREGRLRAERWPRGLLPVAIAAFAGYALAAVGIMTAGAVRATSELTASAGAISLPAWTVGPMLALAVLAIALAQTAALHVPAWLMILLTTVTSLVLLSAGANDFEGGLVSTGRIASVVAVAGIWALVAMRRRRRYAWGEFAIVFALVAVGIGVAAANTARRAAEFGIEAGPLTLAGIMQNIGILAYPAAIAAGAAVAQLACTMATESVSSVRRNLPVVIGGVLLAGLIVWRGWALVAVFASPAPIGVVPIVSAVLLLAVVAGSWMLLARVRGRVELPSPVELESRFGAVAQAIAALLVIGIVPTTILYMLTGILYTVTFDDVVSAWPSAAADVIGDELVIWSVRLAVGAGLVWLAFRGARRGATTTPELFAAIGIVTAAVAGLGLLGLADLLWTGPALTVVVTIAAFALLMAWGARRRLTVERGAALGTALLIAALFDQRTFVEDPLRALFGFTGLAFVLFGFVWSMLTGGAVANRTSRRYPRPSRVLFYLANALFGVTVLAFAALARDPDAVIDLGPPAMLGDDLLGTGLLTAALLAALATALLPSLTSAGAVRDADRDADRDAAKAPASGDESPRAR